MDEFAFIMSGDTTPLLQNAHSASVTSFANAALFATCFLESLRRNSPSKTGGPLEAVRDVWRPKL